eukprot:41345-Eustigmatos_ZCMA.PRE.1
MECVMGAKTLGNLYLRPGRVAIWVIAQLIKVLVHLDEKVSLGRSWTNSSSLHSSNLCSRAGHTA